MGKQAENRKRRQGISLMHGTVEKKKRSLKPSLKKQLERNGEYAQKTVDDHPHMQECEIFGLREALARSHPALSFGVRRVAGVTLLRRRRALRRLVLFLVVALNTSSTRQATLMDVLDACSGSRLYDRRVAILGHKSMLWTGGRPWNRAERRRR